MFVEEDRLLRLSPSTNRRPRLATFTDSVCHGKDCRQDASSCSAYFRQHLWNIRELSDVDTGGRLLNEWLHRTTLTLKLWKRIDSFGQNLPFEIHRNSFPTKLNSAFSNKSQIPGYSQKLKIKCTKWNISHFLNYF